MNLTPPLRWICALVALVLAGPAGAMITNGDFESGLTGWSVTGDASVQGTGFGTGTSNQIVLSTINSSLSNSLEPGSTISGSDAVPVATIESLMGAPAGSFDPPVSPGIRDPQEGSAAVQTVTGVQANSTLQLEWNFLTDETTINPSYDDFAVVYVRETTGSGFESTSRLVNVSAATFTGSGTIFADETGYQTGSGQFTLNLPVLGDYVIGIAVFDWRDQLGASGLAVDNMQIIAAAEPRTAVLLALGLLGLAWYGRSRELSPRDPSSAR